VVTDRICRTVVWRRLDGLGAEHCSLAQRADGWRIEGTAIRAEGGPLLVRYRIACDTMWRTRVVEIEVEMGTDIHTLRMTADEDQRWWNADAEVVAFRGCTDVDLGITPVLISP
jgi:hypothetical protein